MDLALRETTLLFEKTRHFDIIPARHCAKIFRKDQASKCGRRIFGGHVGIPPQALHPITKKRDLTY